MFYKCGKDLNGSAVKIYSRGEIRAVDETVRMDDDLKVFDQLRATYASLNNRHLVDWSIFYRAMWLDADMDTEQ